VFPINIPQSLHDWECNLLSTSAAHYAFCGVIRVWTLTDWRGCSRPGYGSVQSCRNTQDVTEVRTASIIMALLLLHSVTSQRALIFILAAVGKWNLHHTDRRNIIVRVNSDFLTCLVETVLASREHHLPIYLAVSVVKRQAHMSLFHSVCNMDAIDYSPWPLFLLALWRLCWVHWWLKAARSIAGMNIQSELVT
jgi:hypothetical protein